jgi:hypothetical protein
VVSCEQDAIDNSQFTIDNPSLFSPHGAGDNQIQKAAISAQARIYL